jgi:hypothetical protein
VAELKATAQLVCPNCGFRIQGQGQAQCQPLAPVAKPASKPAAPPKAQPAAPLPSAKPATPAATVKSAAPPAPAKPVQATPIHAKPAALALAAPSPPLAAPVIAASKSTAAPSPPSATPVAAPPAEATSSQAPAATPAAGADSLPGEAFFNPDFGATTGTLVRTPTTTKRKFSWTRLLIIFFAVGFAVCIVVAAFGTLVWLWPGMSRFRDMFSDTAGETYIYKIRNSKNETEPVCKLVLPKKAWLPDSETASRLGALAAWKSAESDFWFALAVKDYSRSKPRDAEMLRIAMEKLDALFGEDMELGAKAEHIKFAGLEAEKLQFRGVVKEARWLGECHAFFNNGIAYWLFIASPDEKVVEHFAGELPEKYIFVLSERRGWREQPAPTETFSSSDAKLNMTAPKGVWEKSTDATSYYQSGILLLAGRYREKDNKKNALLNVFTIEKKGDLKEALKAARDLLEAKEKDSNERAKILHAADDGQTESGIQEDIGNRPGRLVDLKLQIGDELEPQRYYLLSVVNEPDVCYAILCECSWKSRPIWRQDFMDVLRTLQVK